MSWILGSQLIHAFNSINSPYTWSIENVWKPARKIHKNVCVRRVEFKLLEPIGYSSRVKFISLKLTWVLLYFLVIFSHIHIWTYFVLNFDWSQPTSTHSQVTWCQIAVLYLYVVGLHRIFGLGTACRCQQNNIV